MKTRIIALIILAAAFAPAGVVFLSGCAGPRPAGAPSVAAVAGNIREAQAAGARAQAAEEAAKTAIGGAQSDAQRADAKATVVMEWLKSH